MNKAEALERVKELNDYEIRMIKREVETFAVRQMGMSVSDWLKRATIDDLIQIAKIVKDEEVRLMESRKIYYLAVWNETGKVWANQHLRGKLDVDWFTVNRVGDGYKANTIGRVTGNVLDPIPVECLDLVS